MRAFIIAMAAVCCAVEAVSGQVTPIGPFTGEFSDGFNWAVPGSAVPSKNLFDGRVIIAEPFGGGGSVKVEGFSSLGGNALTPHTGPWMVGVLFGDGDLRPATFTFNNNNVHRFGGYFGNNSPTNDAQMEFFDINGLLLGSFVLDIPSAGNIWRWHGFESVTPIRTITFKGFSPAPFSGGFILYDDMELGIGNPPPPQGACCAEDGSCGIMTEQSCVDAGGQYEGDGTTCIDLNGNGMPDVCETTLLNGACCLPIGVCVNTSVENCAQFSGTFQGAGITCDDANGNGQADACEPPCDGDTNGDRVIGIDDFLAVLGQWGPCASCSADVDADFQVGINDFLMVLSAWGACP